jgi:anthranilate synthase/aminodeoxychorismate synthase-like glutamine amidotransferase
MLQTIIDENSGERISVFRNDQIDFASIKSMNPDRIVLSPGPGHPAVDSDFGVCKDIILRQPELRSPILGVCLGHQGMAHHYGGTVIQAPEIVHGKMSTIKLVAKSPLFVGIDQSFDAMRYHSLVAAEEDFPDCLEITAREANKGLIMALQHKNLPVYGVQFHPESIGTPNGNMILRNFIEKC